MFLKARLLSLMKTWRKGFPLGSQVAPGDEYR